MASLSFGNVHKCWHGHNPTVEILILKCPSMPPKGASAHLLAESLLEDHQ